MLRVFNSWNYITKMTSGQLVYIDCSSCSLTVYGMQWL